MGQFSIFPKKLFGPMNAEKFRKSRTCVCSKSLFLSWNENGNENFVFASDETCIRICIYRYIYGYIYNCICIGSVYVSLSICICSYMTVFMNTFHWILFYFYTTSIYTKAWLNFHTKHTKYRSS